MFARLAPAAVFERVELQSVQSVTSTATVTAFSSGVTHQIPLGQITLSVVLQEEDQQAPRSSLGSSGSDIAGDSDDAADSGSNEEDDESMTHNPTALAVLDANLAAARVCTSCILVLCA